MDERQTQMMTVLGILAVGALLAAHYIDPAEEDEGSDEAQDLAEVEPADVTSLTLVTKEGTLVADHSPQGWSLTRPSAGAADEQALDDLVMLVDRLSAEPPMEGAALADFGLDDPTASLTLALADGGELKLKVGMETPVGYKSYIVWGDETDPRIAKGQPAETLGLPFARYRDRGVMTLVETGVEQIAWSAGEQSWEATRGEAGGWFLSDGRRARSSVLDGMLKEANLIEYEGFFEDLTDMEAGLLPPRGVLSFDGVELAIGGEHAGGVVVRNPEGITGTVGRVDALVVSAEDLVEDRLLAVPLAGLDRVTATPAGGAEQVWEQTGEVWTRDGEPDPLAGQTPFSLVSAATCDRGQQPEGDFGAVWLTLTARSLTDEVTVEIGAPVEGGRLGREAGGPTFLVPEGTVTQLTTALGL